MNKILLLTKDRHIKTVISRIIQSVNYNSEIYHCNLCYNSLLIADKQDINIFIIDFPIEDNFGLEIAYQIRGIRKYSMTPILIFSNTIGLELEAYSQIHCYYFFKKPANLVQVSKILNILLSNDEIEQSILRLKSNNIIYSFKQSEIIYIERLNRKLIVNTTENTLDFSGYSLQKISLQLPDNYIRCHRSYIVNKSYIKKIDIKNNKLYLYHHNRPISIGRGFKDNLLKYN